MDNIPFRLVAVGILSGATGIIIYQQTGLVSGIVATVFSAVILFFTSTKIGIWNSLGTLTNPFVSWFVYLALAFIYFSYEGNGFWLATAKSVGAALIGSAFSMLLYKYWNI